MGLERTLKELVLRLNRPLLFFIPKDLIPTDNLEKFNIIEKEKFFDRTIIYNQDSQINGAISSWDYVQVLQKPTLLGNNMLRLVDEEASLNPSQFNTLLEKYSMHLRFYLFISKWMAEHINAHCIIDKNIHGYFEFQKDAYQNHKREVEIKFGLLILVDLTSSEILRYIKKDTPVPISEVINKDNEVPKNTEQENLDIQKSPKPKKQLLITDEEAREFIMETVFNQKE